MVGTNLSKQQSPSSISYILMEGLHLPTGKESGIAQFVWKFLLKFNSTVIWKPVEG